MATMRPLEMHDWVTFGPDDPPTAEECLKCGTRRTEDAAGWLYITRHLESHDEPSCWLDDPDDDEAWERLDRQIDAAKEDPRAELGDRARWDAKDEAARGGR